MSKKPAPATPAGWPNNPRQINPGKLHTGEGWQERETWAFTKLSDSRARLKYTHGAGPGVRGRGHSVAKFVVNPRTMGEQIVEAESFQLLSDYWYFFDADEKTCRVIAAKAVGEIERRED